MNRSTHALCLAGIMLVFSILPDGRAAITNLSAVADAFIHDVAPDNNAGAYASADAGTTAGSGGPSSRRGLYLFDLTIIPAGSIVTSVTFRTDVVKTPPLASDSTFDLFEITGLWTEGEQAGVSGAPAAPGECTWNSRQHAVATWTNAGADFLPTALASTPISANGTYDWTGAGLLATVQDWIDQPARNSGLLMKSQAEGTERTVRQFRAREGGAPATLILGFDPPQTLPPSALKNLQLLSTNLSLTWTNNPGRKYDVLFANRLSGVQDWRIAEANIPADPAGTNLWTDPPYFAGPTHPSNAATFYGLRELPASPTGLPVEVSLVATGLVSPVTAAHAGDGSHRLFVCEQRGTVLIINSNKTLHPTPFLDITASVTNLNASYDERGLLGLAFHPGYATNRKFYLYYSAPKTGAGINHESRVSEFLCTTTNANAADPASERIVLRFDEPQSNHNGGSLAFGPDGYLYISTGDGGGANDAHPPFGNGQNRSNLLGKILRIDVDAALPYAVPADNPFVAVSGARPEIFAYGFRNPWKAAFDGTNCWVADVGQNLWEEINLLRKGGNFGWRILEGHHAFDIGVSVTTGVDVATLDAPIHEYKHGPLGISITGGFVYRGTNYPALQGKYVFGDFSTSFAIPDGALYYLDETRAGLWERFAFWMAPTGGRLGRYVKGFGLDEAGEIYLLGSTNAGPSGTSGIVGQLVPPP